MQLIWKFPLISTFNGERFYLPVWVLILFALGGILLLTLTMHLIHAFGWLHGRYAKWMLVS